MARLLTATNFAHVDPPAPQVNSMRPEPHVVQPSLQRLGNIALSSSPGEKDNDRIYMFLNNPLNCRGRVQQSMVGVASQSPNPTPWNGGSRHVRTGPRSLEDAGFSGGKGREDRPGLDGSC